MAVPLVASGYSTNPAGEIRYLPGKMYRHTLMQNSTKQRILGYFKAYVQCPTWVTPPVSSFQQTARGRSNWGPTERSRFLPWLLGASHLEHQKYQNGSRSERP